MTRFEVIQDLTITLPQFDVKLNIFQGHETILRHTLDNLFTRLTLGLLVTVQRCYYKTNGQILESSY